MNNTTDPSRPSKHHVSVQSQDTIHKYQEYILITSNPQNDTSILYYCFYQIHVPCVMILRYKGCLKQIQISK